MQVTHTMTSFMSVIIWVNFPISLIRHCECYVIREKMRLFPHWKRFGFCVGCFYKWMVTGSYLFHFLLFATTLAVMDCHLLSFHNLYTGTKNIMTAFLATGL